MDIKTRVKEHYDFVLQHYKESQILGVFLYGSQNYNLHTEESDVDTKAIYIPTLEELAFEKPISKELVLPNGEHCEVKDIREMIKNFKKQNINFIELLFTDYCIINEKYAKLWHEYFIVPREAIARYNPHQAVQSMSHQALHTLRQAANGTDTAKKIANSLRLVYFLERYLRGDDYISCLVPEGEALKVMRSIKKSEYDDYFLAYQILRTSLENYASGNYEHLTNKDAQIHFDELMRKGALEMIKLNF